MKTGNMFGDIADKSVILR